MTDAPLTDWIGREETLADTIAPVPVAALRATLDLDPDGVAPGTPLPPLWHWLSFLPVRRQSEIGPDGHPRRGGFLPPVPLPRRMWAGSQLEYARRCAVGDAVGAHVAHRRRRGKGRRERGSSSSPCSTRCGAPARPTPRSSSATTSSIARLRRPARPRPDAGADRRRVHVRIECRPRAALPATPR